MVYNAWHKQSYKEFVNKFKAKHTTDDCITPPKIYDAVASWACKKYNIKPENVVRPFWPGQDYKNYDYKKDDVVIDNPPFSICKKITKYYQQKGIKFFLFAPGMTVFNLLLNNSGVCAVVISTSIKYKNDANITTSFITNLDSTYAAITAPELSKNIEEIQTKQDEKGNKKRHLPKYKYLEETLTVSELKKFCKYGLSFKVNQKDFKFTRALDMQRKKNKQFFGGGLIVSEAVAKAKAKAKVKDYDIVWTLSPREKEIVKDLGKN